MPDPSDYAWVDEVLGDAACVTAIAGATREAVLAAFRTEVSPRDVGAIDAHEVPGGVIAVELNGFQGARDEVLRRLSDHGRAASIYWNVEDDNAFSCARDGRVESTVDMYDAETPEDVDLPDDLMSLFVSAAEDDGVSLWAVGLAMVEACTGVVVSEEAIRAAGPPQPIGDADERKSPAMSDHMPLNAIAGHLRDGLLPVLRTDFTDNEVWAALLSRLRAERFGELVAPLADQSLSGMNEFALRDVMGGQMSGHILLADARSMREQAAGREVTLLWFEASIDWNAALHAGDELLGLFRCPVEHVAEVLTNLNLGYLDIEDFSDLVDDDGVFRRVV